MSLHLLEFHTESLSSSYIMTEFDVILIFFQSSGISTKRQLCPGKIKSVFWIALEFENEFSVVTTKNNVYFSQNIHCGTLFFTKHSLWDFVFHRTSIVGLSFSQNIHCGTLFIFHSTFIVGLCLFFTEHSLWDFVLNRSFIVGLHFSQNMHSGTSFFTEHPLWDFFFHRTSIVGLFFTEHPLWDFVLNRTFIVGHYFSQNINCGTFFSQNIHCGTLF